MSAKKSTAGGAGPQQRTLFSFFGKPSQSQDQQSKNVSPDSLVKKSPAPIGSVNVNEHKENVNRAPSAQSGTPLRVGGLRKEATTPASADRRVRFSVSENKSAKKEPKKKKEEDEEEPEVVEDDDEEVVVSSAKAKGKKGKRRTVVMSDSDDDDAMEVSTKDDDDDVSITAVSPAAKKRRAPPAKKGKTKRQRRDGSDDESDADDDSFIVDEDEEDDDDDAEEEDDDEEDEKPSRGKKGGKANRSLNTSRASGAGTPVSSRTKDRLSSFQSSAVSDETAESGDGTHYPHMVSPLYDFLRPEKIRDAMKRRPDEPDYDQTTLYVPPDFLNKQTPALKQWWQMKTKYYDTVLCFKLGKFYELYHQDATTAVSELGLIYMRGEVAHCGFPEIAYARYADMLVQRGYKVGRVEQTETPQAAADRAKTAKSPGSKSPAADREKVVRREMCQIVSAGTRTPDMMCGGLGDSSTGCLLAIAERLIPDSDRLQIGVAFVDTTIGQFHLSEFTDDRARSSLRTVIAANRPAQIITDRKRTSEETQRVLSTSAPSAMRESVPSSGVAWNAEALVKDLAKSDYFRKNSDAPEVEWPSAIKEMLQDPSSGVPKPDAKYELCLAALGAIVTYLRRCLIDETLLSLRQFEMYIPPDVSPPSDGKQSSSSQILASRVVLDSITLRNLDLMENSATGTLEGTLFELLDNCSTDFGRRQLKEWIASPLTRLADIVDRQKAISELGHDLGLTKSVQKLLSKLPDLDRSLNKMHTFGHPSKSSGHPDSRAVLFEDDTYRKRRIEELVTAMRGFRTSVDIFKLFTKSVADSDGFSSKILAKCALMEGDGLGIVPDIEPILDELETLFDLDEAKKTGKITPKLGLCPAYDEACSNVNEIKQNLEDLKDEYRKQLRVSKIEYFGSARNRYQLEIPESVKVPSTFMFTSKRKGFKRFRTPEIEEEFQQLQQAEERREAAMRDSMRVTFAKFDEYFAKWQKVVRCLATVDCLLALANYSSTADFCVPQFVDASDNDGKPFIAIERGCHPCLLPKIGSSLISNDTYINYNSAASSLILTGPNMGGKSTLMRQVGLLVVLAHLGCSVPAANMRLSPVDRIFTRMGASDRILAGESTFYVELAETSVILQRATEHSLVLLDELGRGTATYDGLSVAAAVLEYLASKVKCRTIFSTHYHLLVSTLASSSSSCSNQVSLCHMACKVDNDGVTDGGIETITFLYQLVPGACPRSYGFNAARLAGLPTNLIERASAKAAEFEREERISRRVRTLYQTDSVDQLFDKLKIVDRQ